MLFNSTAFAVFLPLMLAVYWVLRGSARRWALLGEGVMTAVFSSYRHWNDCRLIAQRLARGAPIAANSRVRCDNRGWAEWLGSVQPVEDDPVLPRPVPADARGPATIEEGNPSRQALRDAIRILRDAGVTVRLLEMPQRTTARGRFHPKDNPAYRAFLQELVSERQVTVIRPPDGLVADSDFFDTEHLNADGAAKPSRWLVRDAAAVVASSNRQG